MIDFSLPPPAIIIPAEPKLLLPARDLWVPQRAAPVKRGLGALQAAMLMQKVAASSAPTSLTFVASGGGTTTTVTIPGTPTAGDFCIIWTWGRNTFTTGPGAGPAGFTEFLYDNTAGGGSLHGKVLTGSETTVTTYAGSNGVHRWLAFTVRPNSAISGVTWNSSNSESTVNNPVAQTVTVAGAPIIVTGQMGSSGAVSPRTTTPAMNELNDHASTNQYAHYLIYNSSPSNQSYDMDDEGSQNVLQSGYFAFT